ncbi:MAG: hypothetical protein MR354_08460, partial [Bacteroides xylanisolvens]|nr:hypothetical protein [Bacteroides xylanisolvens]
YRQTATLLTRQDFNEFFFTHFLHSLFSGKDRDLKIQRQRVLYRGLTFKYAAPGGMSYRCIDGWVNYTLKIQVRDGRYKVTMGDFNHETSDLEWKKTWSFGLITDREKYKEKGMQDKRWTKTWPDLKLKCEREYMAMIVSLSDATSGKSQILDTNNDW